VHNTFIFDENPYGIAKDGRVTDEILYSSAGDEEGKVIAPANSEVDDKGNLIGKVAVRGSDQLLEVLPSKVDFLYLLNKSFPSLRANSIL
jgi:DNA-directed RNA polymerase subunit beta